MLVLRCLRLSPALSQASLPVYYSTQYAAKKKSIFEPEPISKPNPYLVQYIESISNPDKFWRKIASELHFEHISENGLEYNFNPKKGDVFIKFMDGSITNVAYNCLERNILKGLGARVAYKWEGNVPGDDKELTYGELRAKVVEFARVLKSRGIKKGDTVSIYLPMTLELPIAMLACARIGAVHAVVFAGFSADALAQRIQQCQAKLLVTCDGFWRGTKFIDQKRIADDAVKISAENGHEVESVLCHRHLQNVTQPPGIPDPEVAEIRDDEDYEIALVKARDTFAPVEWKSAEDPLFVLYTSGSTGAPKGIVHTTAGFMTSAYFSTRSSFDAQPDEDIYWCTADIGWITGHTYGVYGPLLNGMTSVIYEGVPSYPDYSRQWEMCERHEVTKLYTSPTAVRSMMAFPKELVTRYDRSKLEIIGTVGEPMNPSAWTWLNEVVGENHVKIVDTYWQTETGCHLLTSHHSAVAQSPTSGNLPFVGIVPQLIDETGEVVEGPGQGTLVIDRAWPGMMRTIRNDHDRFVKAYFAPFPGYYFTGDGAKRDEFNHYWVTGRVDDLMNVSGHLLSTAEIEAAIASHPHAVEAAVVAIPHDVKGQVPYAYVVLPDKEHYNDETLSTIKSIVRRRIGAIAIPEVIQFAPHLPKTRSGKIVRRILRKIAEGKRDDMGDITTLADEHVIDELWNTRPRHPGAA